MPDFTQSARTNFDFGSNFARLRADALDRRIRQQERREDVDHRLAQFDEQVRQAKALEALRQLQEARYGRQEDRLGARESREEQAFEQALADREREEALVQQVEGSYGVDAAEGATMEELDALIRARESVRNREQIGDAGAFRRGYFGRFGIPTSGLDDEALGGLGATDLQGALYGGRRGGGAGDPKDPKKEPLSSLVTAARLYGAELTTQGERNPFYNPVLARQLEQEIANRFQVGDVPVSVEDIQDAAKWLESGHFTKDEYLEIVRRYNAQRER